MIESNPLKYFQMSDEWCPERMDIVEIAYHSVMVEELDRICDDVGLQQIKPHRSLVVVACIQEDCILQAATQFLHLEMR